MSNFADFDVLVVGAGFAGLYAIHRFRRQGLSVKVFEKAPEVGGCWYWNKYPGCRCDIPSVDYSYGFSPELDQEWTWPEAYSKQADILNYIKHVADKFDLRKDIQFNSEVTAVTFLDDQRLWEITTADGEKTTGTYCVMATGGLSVPTKPKLAGVDTYAGLELHTAAWPEGVDLKGKRVGIIGTGSSGVQVVPEIAPEVEHLYVFQRTPAYATPAFEPTMTPEMMDRVKANYPRIRETQQFTPRAVANFNARTGAFAPLPDDFLTQGGRVDFRGTSGGNIKGLTTEELAELIKNYGIGHLLNFQDIYFDEESNEKASDIFRGYVKSSVRDPETADSLTPKNYGIGCKRPVRDRSYYQTFNRDNVTLVDLQKQPLEEVNPAGIRTSANQYDLDVLIYATGFDALTGALLKANITGRGGLKLTEKWQYGPVGYLGLQIEGFPNLFAVTGPGSPSALANMVVGIEQHINFIADCLAFMKEKHYAEVEPTKDAVDEWVSICNKLAEGTSYTASGCKSWYLGTNIPGKPQVFMPYIGGYHIFKQHCDNVARNDYAGFAFR
ncbi:NAD(P)/FAD-dependent oxidoreductase [Rhizobium sp. S152]|uniref:flavin-containing monooxygenase n=1 Tax=Rhizobium sp. S152 TaxID=3055038 RepID=UPI0025A9F752|nr:NAD(P)/FAD-dependent oxidoreductase [Rhizobium sp. S152]MDM9624732.1 NAD(P)/FAD-dependent oxidoreductase [Rhizobium sp. S152]